MNSISEQEEKLMNEFDERIRKVIFRQDPTGKKRGILTNAMHLRSMIRVLEFHFFYLVCADIENGAKNKEQALACWREFQGQLIDYMNEMKSESLEKMKD